MKSFRHAKPLALDPGKPTLRERAAVLRSSTTQVLQGTPQKLANAAETPKAVRPISASDAAGIADPILALIEEGRWLLAISDAAFAVSEPTTGDTPRWIVQARDEALENLVGHCRGVLLETVPQTAAGCHELARFAVEYFEHQEVPISDDHQAVTSLIARSPFFRSGEQASPLSASGVPLTSTPSVAPIKLAEACDWAVKHVVWINDACGGDAWDDERFEVEIAKHSEIWERAIAEPAKSFSDLAAKARLFGEDWERHTPDDGSRDGLDRMVASILQDVAALEAAPPSLLHDIIAGWAEWTKMRGVDESPIGLAAWERTAALRDDLISRAVALPATAENIPAKALALSWLEYVDLWFDNKPREAYCSDGKLALDIHAAAQADA